MAVAAVVVLVAAWGPAGIASADITYAPYEVIDLARPGDGLIDVADPHVIKVGDTWFLYGTSSGAGLEVWSSTDLASWAYGGLVWQPTPASWNDNGSFWAPDVVETPDGYYLYYTASGRIGVARSASPLGPFVDLLDHPLVGGGYGGVGDGVYVGTPSSPDPLLDLDEHAIDAFLLRASDGSLTLYFSNSEPVPVISALRMADYSTPLDAAPTVLVEAQVNGWEGVVREGPWVVEHGGMFHLMYSGNMANTTCYGVGDALGPTPLGPFTRRADNPILHDDPAVGFYGPGHHSIVEGATGDLLMFFHTKNEYAVGWPRRVRYAPVSFDQAGQLRFDVAPPGDSSPGHSSCAPATTTTTTAPPASGSTPSTTAASPGTSQRSGSVSGAATGAASARASVAVPRFTG